LTLFRRDRLRSLEVTLGGRIVAPYNIARVQQPNEQQQHLYQGWLNTPLIKEK
jgi:predicted metalloprotease with PDZ domain